MRLRRLLLALAAVPALAGGGLAGVEGTHHDMRLYGVLGDQGVCSYCHVPHRAQGEVGLFARAGAGEGLGPIGSFCYSCHDGTVVPTAIVEAPDGTLGLEALLRSHGYEIARLEVKTGGLETAAHVQASGLVKPDPATGALPARMECTACHDPHADQNPPFLKAPLGELCQKCHSGADRLGRGRYGAVEHAGAANGPHPVGMSVAFSGKDRRRPGQAEPEMVFNAVDPRLRVPGLTARELRDPDQHWTTGGHLADLGGDPAVGGVSCATCHSAHSVGANLLVLPAYSAADGTDPLCAGCHGREHSPQNPGGTPYYHPVHGESELPYATSTTPQRPLDIAIPGDWPVGYRGALLCATCHRMHRGRDGAACLRPEPGGHRYACGACHLTNDDVSGENAHHMTSREDRSLLLLGRTLSWSAGRGEPGDLTDGLTCIDCHTELAKSGHNW